jgi:two-component system LytT family response regulator
LQKEWSLTVSKNLKFFDDILSDYGFYRIHNSTVINLKYIARINKAAGGSVIMEGGEEFSVSKSRKSEFYELVNF